VIAALYVERGGPYFSMPGVDPWDVERDARKYEGPHAVVAHPPCGPWGQLRSRYKGTDHDCAPAAMTAVQRFGGVLEHPARSLLWRAHQLPEPGEFPDRFGGVTIAVNQVEWGHACAKPTWLYIVGARPVVEPPYPGRRPTHAIWWGRRERERGDATVLLASAEIRRRTPPLFAQWLADIASRSAT